MSVVVIGLNHRTAPLELLERTTVDRSRLPKALHDLVARAHLSEAVVKRLESMRATPTMFQGEAIAIDFIFTFDFQMP